MKTETFYATFVTLLLCISASLFAQNPTFQWAHQVGGLNYDDGISIITDALENVYTTGTFSGTVDFDPGEGTSNLTSVGEADVFIQKLDANGQFLWAKQMGGLNDDWAVSIAIDGNGNIITTGNFEGSADFDPSESTLMLTAIGQSDVFIQKLSPNGDFLWAKQVGGSSYDESSSIAVDENNNVFITGYFSGTADFDPGTSESNLTSFGDQDIYIVKLNSEGNFLWARQMGGTLNEVGNSVATDANGNVISTGYFGGTADFDPGAATQSFTSEGDFDIYIQKLDANGNFLWARQLGGSSDDYGYCVATDASGNVFTLGDFMETVDFDPGTASSNLISAGDADVFIQKLDANGNFIWAKQLGGQYFDHGSNMHVNASGFIFSTGVFSDIVDFDPSVQTLNLTSLGGYDIYVQNLDSDGNLVWAISCGGNNSEEGNDITTDVSGNVYTIGGFIATVDLDPGFGIQNFTSFGSNDFFIQKLNQNPVGISSYSNSDSFMVFPNPSNGQFSIRFEANQKAVVVKVFSITGQEIMSMQFQNVENIQLELDQADGIYFLEIQDELKMKSTIKIVKQ
jgi:hypothetical protein